MQIQAIDYDSFFWLQIILPHILPHIKPRVTEGISKSDLDLVRRVGLRMVGPCVSDRRFT